MDQTIPPSPDQRQNLIADLIRYFLAEGFIVHGALRTEGYEQPQSVRNDGYGSAKPRRPDVVGFDPMMKRIVFGLVREDRKSMESEEALEEYNVFLDHNRNLGDRASVLYVLVPAPLLQDFTSLITHYIHRDYWHRIVPVGAPPQVSSG